MEQRFLELYNQELLFLRELGAEFAQSYPKIAARLGLEELECADPYVERLLEGFAFLTARVQLKLDARYPQFTQHLLECVYPGLLAPVPSCVIAEFEPAREQGALKEGVTIARGSALRTVLAKGERTACEFRTAQDVTLWPVEIADARYISGSGALTSLGIATDAGVRGALRLRLQTFDGSPLGALPLNGLTVHLKAEAAIAGRLYEELTAHCVGLMLRGTGTSAAAARIEGGKVEPIGFDDDEALLPLSPRGFPGYRLLAEYFTLPERYLFVRISELGAALRSLREPSCDLFVLLDRTDAALDNALDARQFRLNCTPAINLFPKVLDRTVIEAFHTESHLLADRNRPLDFEVATVERVRSVGSGGERLEEVAPLYRVRANPIAAGGGAHYTVQRRPRVISSRAERLGARTAYLGSECFLSLSVPAGRDAGVAKRQLDIEALCTNRDLPILARFGLGGTDFTFEGAAPIESIRCVTGPTSPRLSPAFGETAWRLVSHLAVNVLSLSERSGDEGAELLRRMLRLYANPLDAAAKRQIDGIQRIEYRPVIRRIPGGGPISFGRGLSIDLTVDETGFEGGSALVLVAVLERFFARYASINAFTQLRAQSIRRGLLRTFAPRTGTRALL